MKMGLLLEKCVGEVVREVLVVVEGRKRV